MISRSTKARTEAPEGLSMYSNRSAVASVCKKRIATIASTQAASENTSCTKPRMKPPIAATPTIRNTMMSNPVTWWNLRGGHNSVNELGQTGKSGEPQACYVLEPVLGPIAQLEPQLGRFAQAQTGVGDGTYFPGERDFAEPNPAQRQRLVRQRRNQRCRHREIGRWIGQAVSPGYVEIDF